MYVWVRANLKLQKEMDSNQNTGKDSEDDHKCYLISKEFELPVITTDSVKMAKPICMVEKSLMYQNQPIPKLSFRTDENKCKGSNDDTIKSDTKSNNNSRGKRYAKEVKKESGGKLKPHSILSDKTNHNLF